MSNSTGSQFNDFVRKHENEIESKATEVLRQSGISQPTPEQVQDKFWEVADKLYHTVKL